MKLEIKKFDPKTMLKNDSVVLIMAPRNRGKSVLLKDLLSHHCNIPIGTVISPTEIANKFFQKFIPNILIHEEYDSSILQKFVDRQKKITDQYEKEQEKYGGSDLDPKAFLILDDCLYDKTWPTDKNIRFLFMNGRHVKTLLLITMQYPLGVPPVLRSNVDYVFILRENQIRNRERIYEQYAGMFRSFDEFNQILEQTTQNYECLVINNRANSNKLDEQIFWYKADINKKFKMCSQELWDIQAMEEERKNMGFGNCQPEEPEEPYNPSNVTIKKNVPKINVYKSY